MREVYYQLVLWLPFDWYLEPFLTLRISALHNAQHVVDPKCVCTYLQMAN